MSVRSLSSGLIQGTKPAAFGTNQNAYGADDLEAHAKGHIAGLPIVENDTQVPLHRKGNRLGFTVVDHDGQAP